MLHHHCVAEQQTNGHSPGTAIFFWRTIGEILGVAVLSAVILACAWVFMLNR